jgi:hypothetical protein
VEVAAGLGWFSTTTGSAPGSWLATDFTSSGPALNRAFRCALEAHRCGHFLFRLMAIIAALARRSLLRTSCIPA